jgi:hypothetical protein
MPHLKCVVDDVHSLELEKVFSDVDVLRAFQVYCAKSWSEESLYFLLSIRQFKEHLLFYRIPEIVQEYMSPESHFEINLPSHIRRDILTRSLHWKQLEYNDRINIFDQAYDHIVQLLKNTVFTNFKDDLTLNSLYK